MAQIKEIYRDASDIEIPEVGKNVPEGKIEIPEIESIEIPELGNHISEGNVEIPEIESIEIPEVGRQVPKGNIEIPSNMSVLEVLESEKETTAVKKKLGKGRCDPVSCMGCCGTMFLMGYFAFLIAQSENTEWEFSIQT